MAEKFVVALSTCTPRIPEPEVGSQIGINTRITNIGNTTIPVGWRVHLTLSSTTTGEGVSYDWDYDPWLSPITVGGITDVHLINIDITESMGGVSYDVEIIVYNTDKTVEYGRGKCIGVINAQPTVLAIEVTSITIV